MAGLHPGTIVCLCSHTMYAHCFFLDKPTCCIGHSKTEEDHRCKCDSFKPKKHIIIDGRTNNV